MVPFKPYFLGEQTPPYPRATSVQKCVRTLDIEEVGKTTRHALVLPDGRQLLLRRLLQGGGDPARLGAADRAGRPTAATASPPDRLWATVYLDDDEAVEIWHREVGRAAGAHPAAGQGRQLLVHGRARPVAGRASRSTTTAARSYGKEGGPVVDEDRYLEIWNLVFMQDEPGRGPRQGRTSTSIGELPAKNIDTGMGLERMAAILQGVDNIYEIDTTPADHRPRQRADRQPTTAPTSSTTCGCAWSADHARTAVMLIGDG